MLEQITMGLSSLNAAKDIVKGLDSLKAGVATNEVKINLQGLILEAQEALFAAQQAQTATASRIRELEAEIVRMDDWSAKKQHYDLRKFYPGTLAYILKPELQGTQPTHMLCKHCFDHSERSTLQATGRTHERFRIFACHSCKSELPFGEPMPEQADKRLNG